MVEVAQTAKPRRWWRVVLVLSLAMNVAVVGIVAGAALSGRWRDGPPRGFDLSLGPIGAALDRADRNAIAQRLRGNAELRPRNPQERAAEMMRVLDGLRADPYDPAVLTAFFERNRQRIAGLQGEAQQALIAQVAAMSPAERTAFADRLQEEIARRRPGQRP